MTRFFAASLALSLASTAYAGKIAVISGDGWSAEVKCSAVTIRPFFVSCDDVCAGIDDMPGFTCTIKEGRLIITGHGDPTVLPWMAQDGPADLVLPWGSPVEVGVTEGEHGGELLWLSTVDPIEAQLVTPDGLTELVYGPFDRVLEPGVTLTVTAHAEGAVLFLDPQ